MANLTHLNSPKINRLFNFLHFLRGSRSIDATCEEMMEELKYPQMC